MAIAARTLAKTGRLSHDDWLEIRRTRGIGGSDAAAVAGVSRYRSPLSVWLEKTGQLIPDEPGEAAHWGNVLEDVVAAEFAARTGLKPRRRRAVLQSAQHPFMLANVDRLVSENGSMGILEAKTCGYWRRTEWLDGHVPDEYAIQLQHYLAVTGYTFGYVAVLIGGQEFRHTRVERNDDLIADLIRIEADFWRRVQECDPPPVDETTSPDLLSALYPQATESMTAILPVSAEELIRDYARAQADEKDAVRRKDLAANHLKAFLGEAEIGMIAGRKVVTWKNVGTDRLDTKAFKTEQPDLYKHFTRHTESRRFQIYDEESAE